MHRLLIRIRQQHRFTALLITHGGAVVALHLMRSRPVPMSVTIIEPRPILGGGVAYSAPDSRHRINVPAARMSAYSEDLGHFDRWLRERGYPATDPDSLFEGAHLFPARLEFGRYLDEQVRFYGAQRRVMPGRRCWIASRHYLVSCF